MSSSNDKPQSSGFSRTHLNVSVGVPGLRAEAKDVCEKIGRFLAGEEGAKKGREIDNDTKDLDIHIGI